MGWVLQVSGGHAPMSNSATIGAQSMSFGFIWELKNKSTCPLPVHEKIIPTGMG